MRVDIIKIKIIHSGCGAVVARTLGVGEVGGSIPPSPTNLLIK